MDLRAIQDALVRSGFDGWLFFDHHRRDPIAYRLLGLSPASEPTRRWYYLIPAKGEPRKLVHQIESNVLDVLPGEKSSYSRWQEQERKLRELVAGCKTIAMQYSAKCAIPYVAFVDAGTVEIVAGFGVEVVSSAGLVQEFEARLTALQMKSHVQAGVRVDSVRRRTFEMLREKLQSGEPITEYEVQQFVRKGFADADLVTNHGPIVAVNAHASDPHYEPKPVGNARIKAGDLVLLDLWAKENLPDSVYYDVTWTAYCGQAVPERIARVFEVVRNARRSASDFVIQAVSLKTQIAGWQVDDAARGVIESAGYGEYFFHRTGHSIGTDVHGTGANMDNFECHDERPVISNTTFSIEPGIYLPDFGIRSEVNVMVEEERAYVTGEQQDELVRIESLNRTSQL